MDTSRKPQTNNIVSTLDLIERPALSQERSSRMNWWYRLAAPDWPAAPASLKEREVWRRGRYIANTLLGLIIVASVYAIIVVSFVNYTESITFLLAVALFWVGVFLNKRGQVIVAGIIVVLVLDLGIMSSFLYLNTATVFKQLSLYHLPIFDLLVIPELFTASLLPPRYIFLDMTFHIVFFFCALTFLFPMDTQLVALMHIPATAMGILSNPIVLQIMTAVVAYTWMRSVTKNVERADRATSIAMLEREISLQRERDAEQKRQLESEIEMIVDVHRQVANGNLNASVPLVQGNTLWPLAGSLNNLITRLRGLLRDKQQLSLLEDANAKFYRAREAAYNGYIQWQPTGTVVDAMVQQHNMYVSSVSRPLDQKGK